MCVCVCERERERERERKKERERKGIEEYSRIKMLPKMFVIQVNSQSITETSQNILPPGSGI